MRCVQHGGSTRGVNGHHADTEACGGANSAGNGVGNIMEFQVEEDGVAAIEERFEDGGTGGDEEFETNFEPDAGAFQAVEEIYRCGLVGHIESDDQALAGAFYGVQDSLRLREVG